MDKQFYLNFYGETHADLVEKYLERIDTSILAKEMVVAIKTLQEKGEEDNDSAKDLLSKLINIYREGDFSHGLISGVNHYEALKTEKGLDYEDCDYVKSKDFTIMLDFGDNDFGGYLEEAAEDYVSAYMSLVSRINTYSKHTDSEGAMKMVENYISELEAMESVDYISMFISTSFVAKHVSGHVNDSASFKPQTFGMKEFTMESFIEKAKNTSIEYLSLDKSEMYKTGTFDEIEAHVVKEYKEQQSKGEGQTLKTCWLNGEVLFISMKDGKMKCWVQ